MNRLGAARVLEAMGTFKYHSTLHGFDLFIRHLREPNHHLPVRLTHGGGISGTNRFWWLLKPETDWKSRMVSTKTDLYRLVTEYLAGDRPPDREGYKLFAKLHAYKFGQHYVWQYLKRKEAR